MAGKSAVLSVKILVDAAQAASGLDKAGDSVESFGTKFAKIGAAVGAAAGVTAFIAKTVSAASDLQQSVGAVDAVFKKSAAQIHAWAADTSDDINLSQNDFETFALQIGAQLKNAGTPMEELGTKTHDLIALASDLNAQFGGGTAAAVDTLAAALKGNIETLDNYGVSITAASVNAKILELGLDTSTEAAKAAAKQQATLAIIFEQTKDAQGAAGRESESFATQQERLGVAFDNLLAAVGAPLLGAMSSILGLFTDLAPVITPVAVGVSELLGWVLQLPAPLLAAAAGLVAWQIVGGLTGITTAFATSVRVLTAAMKGLTTGTIVGAVLTGIFIAMTALQDVFSSTDDEIASTTETYDRWLSTLKDGKVTDLTRETIAFDTAQSGLLQTYKDLGVSTQAYLDASTGAEGGQAALAASVQQATNKLFEQGGVFDDVAASLAGAVVSQQDFVDAVASGDLSGITAKVQAYADEQARLTGSTQTGADIMNAFSDAVAAGQAPVSTLANVIGLADQTAGKFGVSADQAGLAAEAMGGKAGEAVDPVKELKEQLDAAQDAADKTGGNAGLVQMKSVAEDAGRATDLLSLALDKLTGGTRSTDAAVAAFNKSITGIGSAFEDTATKGGYSQEALLGWNVAALTTTDAGQGIYDALTQVSGAYETSVGAAYASANANAGNEAALASAQEEAGRAYAAFTGQASAMHLSAEETAALASQLGILDATQLSPKVFEMIAQDQQARQAVTDLQNAGIPAKDFTVNAGVDGALGTVDDLLQYVDKSGATVTVDSTVDPASAAVQGLAKTTNSLTATTTTQTNTAPATQAVTQLAAQTNATSATVAVQANATSALQTIGNVTNGRFQATVAVLGNTDPVSSAIRSVTNGNYTATINVVANVSSATAAIAAVPRSTRAAEAPTLRTTSRTAGLTAQTAAPATTYNFTINAGLGTDGDELARKLETLLRRRDRRSGGTVL